MATDSFEGDNNGFLGRFARVGIGVGVAGYAGQRLWTDLSSNRPIRSVKEALSSVRRSGTELGGTFREAGAQVRRAANRTAARDAEISQRLLEEITAADYITKLSQTAEETRALLDAVLGAMDDPTTGLDQVMNPSVRDDIMNLMARITEDNDVGRFRDQLEEVVGSFTSALAGGPKKNRTVWARHLGEARGLMQNLTAPRRVNATQGLSREVHKGLASLDELYHAGGVTASDKTRKQIGSSLQALETRMGRKVSDFGMADGTIYARITRRRGDGQEFVANYPLANVRGKPGKAGGVAYVEDVGDVLRRISGDRATPVNYHAGENLNAVWRLNEGYVTSEVANIRARTGLPLHAIPSALTDTERDFIGRARSMSRTDLDVALEKQANLRRFGTGRVFDYVQATKGYELSKLPVLSEAILTPVQAIQSEILGQLDSAGSLRALDRRHLQEVLQSEGQIRSRFGLHGGMGVAPRLAAHQEAVERFMTRALRFDLSDLSHKDAMSVVTEMASHPDHIASVSANRVIRTRRYPGRPDKVLADVGIFEGSYVSEMDMIMGGTFRDENGLRMDSDSPIGLYVPKTARPEQASGRLTMFTGDKVHIANELTLGVTDAQFTGKALTGTRTQAYVLVADPRGKNIAPEFMEAVSQFYGQEEPSGQFTHIGRANVRTEYSRKIVAPEDNARAYGRLLDAAGQGQYLEARAGGWYLGDQRMDRFLGRDAQGKAVMLPSISDIQGGRLAIEEIVTNREGGKQLRELRIVGAYDRVIDQYKGFSTVAKGMHERTSEEVFMETARRTGGAGLVEEIIKRGGREALEYTAYGAASTIGKAPGFWDQQILGAHRFLGQTTSGQLKARAQSLHDATVAAKRAAKEVVTGLSPGEKLRVAAQAYMLENQRAVMEGNLDARLLGQTLAGVGSNSVDSETLKYLFDRAEGASKDALSADIASAFKEGRGMFAGLSKKFKDEFASEFLEGMNSSTFLAFADVAIGEGTGDYGGARASMDRRQAAILAANLRGMGLSVQDTSRVLGDMFTRMEFSAESAEAASGLMGMARQLRGVTGMADNLKKVKTIGLSELFEMKGEEGIGDLLRQSGDTLRIDWQKDWATRGQLADEAIAALAHDAFGPEGLDLASGPLFEALEGTTIREAAQGMGDDKVVRQVAGEYENLLNNFFGQLKQYVGSPHVGMSDVQKEEMATTMRRFRDDFIDLAAKTQVASASGKLSGSFMAPLLNYKTDGNLALTAEQSKYIAATQKKARGRAVYASDDALLNMLRNYDGKDLAKRAERVFMSAYDETGRKHKSITSFAVRQPTLGFGHVAPVEVFRAMGADGFSDDALRRFQEATGMYQELGSFRDLHGIQKTGGRYDQFWNDFAAHLKNFSGEGGGVFYAPTDYQDLKGVGMTDMGFMMASGADNDGDHVAMIMADSKHSKMLNKAMRSGDFRALDTHYKHALAGYGKIAGDSIKLLQKNPMYESTSYWDKLGQEVLKESGVKVSTGPVDVQLNQLRMAAFDISMSQGGNEIGRSAARMSALFTTVQERGIIKSKKLGTFVPMGRYITQGIRTAMADGGDTTFLKDILRKTVLSAYDSDIVAGSVTLNLEADMAALDQVVAHARKADWGIDVSAGALSARLRGSKKMAEETFNALSSGAGITGSYTAGYLGHSAASMAAEAQDLVSRVTRAVGRMDLGVGTYAGMAIMGGALAASALAPSYSAEPLTSKYDRPSAAVRDSIASGSALTPTPSSQSVSPPGNAYAMMGHRFDERATYTPRQNAFQVRGQVASPAQLDTAVSVLRMNQSGPGHITVGWNDNRRPITPNYVDRLMGSY